MIDRSIVVFRTLDRFGGNWLSPCSIGVRAWTQNVTVTNQKDQREDATGVKRETSGEPMNKLRCCPALYGSEWNINEGGASYTAREGVWSGAGRWLGQAVTVHMAQRSCRGHPAQ